MANLKALQAKNEARWAAAKITRGTEFAAVAQRLVAAKARYQAVEATTGVPWFVIAVIHQRESSQNFARSLAQGDPWNKVSTHVPAGRGPFPSWEAAAIDALVICPPYAAKWKDWSPGGTMTLLEQYNGLGYANKGIPSPYVWAGTDQYVKGKYVADGKFDPNYVDKQLGCAGLILAMKVIDPSIAFAGEVAAPVPLPPPAPKDVDEKPVDKSAVPVVVTTTTVAAGGAYTVWQFFSDYALHIAAGAFVLVVLILIIFRLAKGSWPWTGRQSQVSSESSLQPSANSLDQLSARLAVLSAGSPVAPSQTLSASKPRRKLSARRSPKTKTPSKSSASSKRPKRSKSPPKRKSR